MTRFERHLIKAWEAGFSIELENNFYRGPALLADLYENHIDGLDFLRNPGGTSMFRIRRVQDGCYIDVRQVMGGAVEIELYTDGCAIERTRYDGAPPARELADVRHWLGDKKQMVGPGWVRGRRAVILMSGQVPTFCGRAWYDQPGKQDDDDPGASNEFQLATCLIPAWVNALSEVPLGPHQYKL